MFQTGEACVWIGTVSEDSQYRSAGREWRSRMGQVGEPRNHEWVPVAGPHWLGTGAGKGEPVLCEHDGLADHAGRARLSGSGGIGRCGRIASPAVLVEER